MDRFQTDEIVRQMIDGGESVLWSGRPAPGAVAIGSLPVSLFGIPFAGFACFWIWGAWQAASQHEQKFGPWVLFPLFGLPFVLVGLGLVTAPLWAWLGALDTVYAVTDRRALIISGRKNRSIQSFDRDDIGELTRVERADGSGTLYFATRTFTSRGRTRQNRIGFIGIPEVRHVERLIREHLAAAA